MSILTLKKVKDVYTLLNVQSYCNINIAHPDRLLHACFTAAVLQENHFDLQIPGGGVGLFNGCKPQWGAPDQGWGAQYGGVSSLAECDQLPAQIRDG